MNFIPISSFEYLLFGLEYFKSIIKKGNSLFTGFEE